MSESFGDPYVYQARLVDIVDGDTMDVAVDVGFHMTRQIRLRLADVDTHETYGVPRESEEFQQGQQETQFVREWIPSDDGDGWPLLIRTAKTGKYGRYIAHVQRRSDGEILNDVLKDTFEGV